MALGLEAGHIAGVADDLGSKDRADSLDLGQGGAVGRYVPSDGLAQHLELAIGAPDVVEELASDRFPLHVGGRQRTDADEEGGRGLCRQFSWGAAWNELAQEDLKAVHGAGALGDDVVSAI
jgi:hypothetical protein